MPKFYKYKSWKVCVAVGDHFKQGLNSGPGGSGEPEPGELCKWCGNTYEEPKKPKRNKMRKQTNTRKTTVMRVELGDGKADLVVTNPGDMLEENTPCGLLKFMGLEIQDGDEIEIIARVVSRLKRVKL